MNIRRLFLTAMTLSVLLVFFSVASNNAWAVQVSPVSADGERAPAFSLKDLSGNEVYLSSFRGRTVLLNFWATWCPYCRKERAHLNSLHREYKDRGLVIISIATDKSAGTVRDFMKNNPADFIVLSDDNKKTSASYKVRGLPTSFLIDREGMIRQKFVGFREWTGNDLKELIGTFVEN